MCVSSACTGLCGGQRVTAVPTATGPKTRLKSGEASTLKELGAGISAAGQELRVPGRKMALGGGHDQR